MNCINVWTRTDRTASAVAVGDGHREVPAGGKLVPDAQQPFASQRRLDPGVDWEPGQQFTQCRIEAAEPPQVQLAKLGLPRGQRGDPRGGTAGHGAEGPDRRRAGTP